MISQSDRAVVRAEALESPVFLVGSERSGTTLLRLMLDRHPAMSVHMEAEFLVNRIGDDGRFPSGKAYARSLRDDRVFEASGFTIDPGLDFPAMARDFLRQRWERGGRRAIIGATVHHHFERLPALWPRARFLHLLRDGRDVSRSVIQMGWAGNVWSAASVWLEAQRSWDALCAIVPPERRFEARYEDLVRDARGALTSICDWLGEPFSERMFDYATEAGSTYGMPDASLAEQWRKKMSPEDLRFFEARAGAVMESRGYARALPDEGPLPPAVERRLARQDRVARAKFRFRRYGTWLYSADWLARRAGIGPLRRWCQQRINAVDWKHVR